jgi:hypothetical protein
MLCAIFLMIVGLSSLPARASAAEMVMVEFAVVDEQDQPVGGATLSLTPMLPRDSTIVLTTDGNGRASAQLEVERFYNVSGTDAAGRETGGVIKPIAGTPNWTFTMYSGLGKLRVQVVGDCGPHSANAQVIIREDPSGPIMNFSVLPIEDFVTFLVRPGSYALDLGFAWAVEQVSVGVRAGEIVDATIVEKLRTCSPPTTAPPAEEAPPSTEPGPSTTTSTPETTTTVPPTTVPPSTTVPPWTTSTVPSTTEAPPTTTPSSTTTTTTEPPLPDSEGGGAAAGLALAGVGGLSGAAMISAVVRARLRASG